MRKDVVTGLMLCVLCVSLLISSCLQKKLIKPRDVDLEPLPEYEIIKEIVEEEKETLPPECRDACSKIIEDKEVCFDGWFQCEKDYEEIVEEADSF